jgi:hypothetical protein
MRGRNIFVGIRISGAAGLQIGAKKNNGLNERNSPNPRNAKRKKLTDQFVSGKEIAQFKARGVIGV